MGIIEGVAEATASMSEIFGRAVGTGFSGASGLAIGYELPALAEPMPAARRNLGLDHGHPLFIDHVGKGLFSDPRDALVADIAPASIRGTAFGLRQSLDTIGELLGPAVAVAAIGARPTASPFVFWIATIPQRFAVVVLALGVREPEACRPPRPARFPLHRRSAQARPPCRMVAGDRRG